VVRKVFLSCVELDRSFVEPVVKHLRGIKILSVDDEIVLGSELPSSGIEIRKEVRQFIHSAELVVVIWSPEAANSRWVNYELGLADAFGVQIVVVCIDKYESPVPSDFSAYQVVNLKPPTGGWFEITKDANGQYSFVLKSGQAEVLLRSEKYSTRASAANGISSVQANIYFEERFDKLTTKDGRAYFNLRAGNHQVIGTSPIYANERLRDEALIRFIAKGTIRAVRITATS
jgi:uncharacterized protein YegP (UPF0339 family)